MVDDVSGLVNPSGKAPLAQAVNRFDIGIPTFQPNSGMVEGYLVRVPHGSTSTGYPVSCHITTTLDISLINLSAAAMARSRYSDSSTMI